MTKEEPAYVSTFIAVAKDCQASRAKVPEKPGTIAAIEFELLAGAPHTLTQADVLWEVHRRRGGGGTRQEFFSRPMACLRASPLGKAYGWGLHFDAEGRVALVARESAVYEALVADPSLEQTRAMASKRR